ncbi:hypothetical protein DQ04_16031000 [Trypanosoma grayi]|uniref:hypothetical protein n=1 Tax=Trypanosoma grayi TaxID=71804 RepID=UPI0004F441E2|nr:hypothetical protein DQ04_16031000 [Trypanosoma grayi]KEG06083.1 hypothetical protein DQ04_16031000 [Trypanosoma grayi]
MWGLQEDFEEAAARAECAEDTMVRRVERVEELLRFSEADAASREAATVERITHMNASLESTCAGVALVGLYEECVASAAVLYGQFVGVKMEMTLELLRCGQQCQGEVDSVSIAASCL